MLFDPVDLCWRVGLVGENFGRSSVEAGRASHIIVSSSVDPFPVWIDATPVGDMSSVSRWS